MIKIGVISDTHRPERVPYSALENIKDNFIGCDYILHTGDIESQHVLDTLGSIAPVYAVRGDDEIDTYDLPERRVIEIDGIRIGIHHSHRPYRQEFPSRMKTALGLQREPTWAGIQQWLLDTFKSDAVQIIVFGHFHRPYNEYHDGILLLNPESIYKLSKDALIYRIKHSASKFRRITAQLERKIQSNKVEYPPTIAYIYIDNAKISTEIIELPPINYQV